jgi:predicted transcriptional regulator
VPQLVVAHRRPRRKPKDAAISLEVESSLKRKLEEIARAEDRSVSHVVREALRRYVEGRTMVAA